MRWLWHKIVATVRFVLFVLAFIVMLGFMIPFQLGLVIYFAIFKATDERKYKYHKLMHVICHWLATHIPGVSVTVLNPENEDFSRPAIVVCNHQSHLDLLYMLMLTPNIIFMAKKWVWRNPLYGLAIKYADFISTEDNHEQNVQKLAHMAEKGYSTVIFPEGTRSAECRIQRFHRGAFHMAEQMQMDILPVVLYGTGKVMNKKAFSITPGKIIIDIMPRIPYDPEVDYRRRASLVKQQMHQEYEAVSC